MQENFGQNIKSFSSDGSEKMVQEIISKLKFISRIKVGEKIDVYALNVISADYWVSRIYRTIVTRGESRENTLEFIQTTNNAAFNIIIQIMNKQESTSAEGNSFFGYIIKTIIEALHESKAGIANLIKTYEADSDFCSRAESINLLTGAKIMEIVRNVNIQTDLLNDK